LGRMKYLKPSSLALIAIGKAPLIGCKLPSKESSSYNIVLIEKIKF
jgi:hypothetical protein